MIGCWEVGLHRTGEQRSSARNSLHGATRGQNISKTYRGRAVVHDVPVHLEQGRVVGLLVHGAGKNHVFHIIVGLISPDSAASGWTRDITHLPMTRRAARHQLSRRRPPCFGERWREPDGHPRDAVGMRARETPCEAATVDRQLAERGAAHPVTRSRAASGGAGDRPSLVIDPRSSAGRARSRNRPISAGIAAHHLRPETAEHRDSGDRPQRKRDAGGDGLAYIITNGELFRPGTPEAWRAIPRCAASTWSNRSPCGCERCGAFVQWKP